MSGFPNPRAMQYCNFLKFNVLIYNTASHKEHFHKFGACSGVRNLVGVITTSKTARVIFIAESRICAPMITNGPQMGKCGGIAQSGR